MRLRTLLAVATLGTIVPLLAFAAALLWWSASLQRQGIERGVRDTARALSLAVDRELGRTEALLGTLAVSPSVDAGDFAALYRHAAALAADGAWITLIKPDGEQVFNTRRAFGSAIPRAAGMEAVRAVVDTRRPYYSNVYVGAVAQRPIVSVDVPVVRNGSVLYTVDMTVGPERFAQLLHDQSLPREWAASILDRRGATVARTRDERSVATLPAEEVRERVLGAPDGWARTGEREGADAYQAWRRSTLSGWTVLVSIPAAVADAPVRRMWMALAGGGAIALVVAATVIGIYGERITSGVTALVKMARALERPPDVTQRPRSSIPEFETVFQALQQGAVALRRVRDDVEAQLASIVDSSGDAMMSGARDGTLLTWNPAAERLFGYTADEICGQRVSILVPPDRRDEFAGLIEAVASGEIRRLDTVRRRKDGSMVQVALTVSPILDRDGGLTGFSATARDISETKRLEEALRAANRAKDEFLAMLGHELRNPLGAIASAVSVLQNVRGTEEAAQRARDVVSRQVQHLSRLVDDLLEVSRVTSSKVVLVRRPTDIAALVTRTVGAWRAAGRFERHKVSLDAASVWANADDTRVEQVVSNLLDNALKYTPPGGAVAIRVADDGDAALVEVADTGVGIPPELMNRVFDLFAQGESAMHRAQGGLGVGLTLVKALVEMHGGTVSAKSAGKDMGTVLTVRLPRVPAPPARQTVSPAPRSGSARRRVLIIEDNADARAMLRTWLELEGHEVHEAADGPAGVDLAARVAPEVVLIDIGLPGLDGYEVARRIRAEQGNAAGMIVALTGYGQAGDRERALEAGFDAHLTKPVFPERLAEVLSGGPRAERAGTTA